MKKLSESPILRHASRWLDRLTGADEVRKTEKAEQQAIADRLAQSEAENEELMVQVMTESAQSKTGWGFITGIDRQSRDKASGWVNRHQAEAHRLWMSHPLARKAMKLKRAFICQQGFRLESDCGNPVVQAHLDRHWQINWERSLKRRVESLNTYGELAYVIPPANPWNGHYKLNALPRNLIQDIKPHPHNFEQAGTLELTDDVLLHKHESPTERRSNFDIVHFDWLSNEFRGDVLYLGVNTLDTQLRGLSDLGPVMDWLDGFDQLTWTEMERVKSMRAFLWHMKITGASAEVIAAEAKKWAAKPFKPGSTLVSNEHRDLTAVAPELNTGESLAFLEFLFKIIWGGLDLPEHFYFTAGDVNRASASEMSEPVYAPIRDRKGDIAELLAADGQIAIDRASKIVGHPLSRVNPRELGVKVVSRDPEQSAYDLIGSQLKGFSEMLMLATTAGWISQQQAGKQFRDACQIRGLGEIPAPEDESLEGSYGSALQQLELKRPSLQRVFPFAPGQAQMQTDGNGDPTGRWAIPSRPGLAAA